jgi:Uma2 family endonuclease
MSIASSSEPTTLPVTVDQFQTLVRSGAFNERRGQIELIRGRIVQMNPQGPEHADPIDELQDWSYEQATEQFRIRVEKPIEIANLDSCPETDVAWVRRGRYQSRHPQPGDVWLLIEVSHSSGEFDRREKLELYASAEIAEYWIVDVREQTITICRDPEGPAYRSMAIHPRDATIAPHCLPAAKLEIARLFPA